MGFEDKKDVKAVSPEGKKPYSKPQLQVYGDLGSITKSSNNGSAAADGGVSPAHTKT